MNMKRDAMEIRTIRVGGMKSDPCVERVQEALLKIPGVAAAMAHFPEGTATFDSREPVQLHEVATALEEAGFTLLA